MGDDMDRTQRVNEEFQAYALERHQRSREPGDYTGTDCIDCKEEIPEDRRKAVPGCRRCIGCQERHERDERQSNRRDI